MAPHRLLCALATSVLGALLTRCGLPLPTYVLADEKHSRCLAAKVYLPTIVMVGGWGIWGTPRRPVQWLLPSPMACFNAPRLNKNRRIGSQGPSPRALTAPPQSLRDALPGGRGPLPAPRPQPTPEETPSERVASAPVSPHAVPHLVVPGTAAQELAGLCAGQRLRHLRPRRAQSREGQWGARPTLVPGQENRLVYGLADPQLPATRTLLDQAHNASERKLFARKGFHHPGGSHQAFLTRRAQLYNLSRISAGLSRPVKAGWKWKAGEYPPQPDAQPANPHLGRLAMSEDTLHHVIRWNVQKITSAFRFPSRSKSWR